MTTIEIQYLLAHTAGHSKHLFETHISWVLLSGEYAWKIKKPRHLPFLDYSTLEKRKYYCEREIELNKLFSNGVYLNVVPIYSNDQRCSFDPPGIMVDYAVKMNRLDNSRQMHILLEHGEVNATHALFLAEALAKAHQALPPVQHEPDLEMIRANIPELRAILRENPDMMPEMVISELDDWEQMVASSLQQLEPRILERAREGWVRACHGDLHCANIFLLEEHPVFFDCIEFNEAFRTLDLLDELAFLCMDIEAHGRRDIASFLAARYDSQLHIFEKDCDYLLFDFFKFYRAAVRFKVALMQGIHHPEKYADWQYNALKYLKNCRIDQAILHSKVC